MIRLLFKLMNWVDFLIILLLVFFGYEGYRRSFISELFYLLSFGLAFFLALNYYNLLAGYLRSGFQLPHSLANVLSFIVVWFVVEAVIFPLVYLLMSRVRPLVRFDQWLRPLAFLPALLRGLIFVSILLVLVGTFPIQPGLKLAVQQSKLGSLILGKTESVEAPLKNVFGGMTEDTLTFLTVKPKSEERLNLGFQTNAYHPDSTLENRMIELVNNERRSRSLSILSYDPKLRDIARGKSGDMFSRGYFSHYSPEGQTVADRAKAAGVGFSVIGENLAYAPNLELAHRGLMNSAGHRANILAEDYQKIGIGVMDGGVYGLMITQVFSN